MLKGPVVTGTLAAPAVPRADVAAHRPLDLRAVRLTPSGPLGAWQERNAAATIPHCIEQLEASGVIDNLRRVVGDLVQAAVAPDRATGRDDLVRIARVFVALVDGRFGPGRFVDIWATPE